MPNEAVSYLRCSGDAQKLGDTWERQQAAVNGYAVANSISIVSEFRDEGVTGKMELENRGGLSDCLRYVKDHKISLVLIESSDRLARDMIVAEVVVREFQKIGVRVVSASGGVDLTAGDDSNPTAKLIRQILAAIAEFDRCVTVLKLRAARDRKRKANGKCDGRKAFGEKPEERDTLEMILTLRFGGETFSSIANILNGSNFRSRTGAKWRASTVAKIVAREETKNVCKTAA